MHSDYLLQDSISQPSSYLSNEEMSYKYPTDPSNKAIDRIRKDQESLKNSDAVQEYSKLSLEIGKMQHRKTVMRRSVHDEPGRSEQEQFMQRQEEQFNSRNNFMTSDHRLVKNDVQNQHVPAEFFTERRTQYPTLNLGRITFQASSFRNGERAAASQYFDDQLLAGTQEHEKACRWDRKQEQAKVDSDFEVKQKNLIERLEKRKEMAQDFLKFEDANSRPEHQLSDERSPVQT